MKINVWEALEIDSDKAKDSVNVKETIEEDAETAVQVEIEEPKEDVTDDFGEAAGEDLAEPEAPQDSDNAETTPLEDASQSAEAQKEILRGRLLAIFESVSSKINHAREEYGDLQEMTEAPQAEEGETAADVEQEAQEIQPAPQAQDAGTEIAVAAEPAESDQLQKSPEQPKNSEPPDVRAPFFTKEKLMDLGRAYGWIGGIAAAFALLIGFMVVYTAMTPREVSATINGEKLSFTSKAHTIEEFLEDEGIAFCEEDYISMPVETFLYDGIRFELEHAADFKVMADGKTKAFKSLEDTVEDALDDVGVEVAEIDIVTPQRAAPLAQNMVISVQRVTIEEETVQESIPFKTVEKKDTTMNEGESKVVKKGKKGKDKVTYEIKYIDGRESSRKEIAREILTKPKKQVVANGTRVVFNGKSYSRKLVVKAYAYTGGGRTAMGTRARVGEIAVDPSVIPLGTNVYIEGVGARRAEDTGGNIKGNTIDIYMSSQAACLRWGVRYVTIYIE